MSRRIQLFRNSPCRPPADSRVDLVKNQSVDIIFARQHSLNSQHDPGKLAPAGHLAQGLQGLPGVGGNQKLHIIKPRRCNVLCPVYGNLKFHCQKIQVNQSILQQPCQHRGVLLSHGGKLFTGLHKAFACFAQLPFQLLHINLIICQLVQQLLPLLAILYYRVDGSAVFSLQPIQHIQPLFYLSIVSLVKFTVGHVLSHIPIIIGQQAVNLRQLSLQLLQTPVVHCDSPQGSQRTAQGAARSIHLISCELIALRQALQNPLTVDHKTVALFQLFILTRNQVGLLDLSPLKLCQRLFSGLGLLIHGLLFHGFLELPAPAVFLLHLLGGLAEFTVAKAVQYFQMFLFVKQ